MFKRQKNKFAMYAAVHSYIDDNLGLYSDNEEFVSHKTSLNNLLNSIRQKEDVRSKATKGKSIDKVLTKSVVIKQALAMSGALYAFAKKTGDQSMLASMDFNQTKLRRLRDVELSIELNSIKDKITENSSEMAKYGITPEKLNSFEANIQTYSKAIAAKDTGGAVKKGATDSLSTLFKNTDSLLHSIDKFMESYIDNDEQFYSGYKSARVIKDIGIRHHHENGSVIPEQPQPDIQNNS